MTIPIGGTPANTHEVSKDTVLYVFEIFILINRCTLCSLNKLRVLEAVCMCGFCNVWVCVCVFRNVWVCVYMWVL